MIGTATPSGLHDFVVGVIGNASSFRGRAAPLSWTRSPCGGPCPRRLSGTSEIPHTRPQRSAFLVGNRIGFVDLVVALEVIEHVESPINFLRMSRNSSPGGCAVITTPNVDSLPARLRFLFGGKIRMMDEFSDPTHISPIFSDLLRRQFLPQAGLRLAEHKVFPPKGYQLTRKPFALPLAILASAFPGDSVLGDNHLFVLEAAK